MICEVLNSFRDTYANLYCVQTLAAFLRGSLKSSTYDSLLPQVVQLTLKLSNCNSGLDETASTFLGQCILNLLQKTSLSSEGVLEVLLNCMRRVSKCNSFNVA